MFSSRTAFAFMVFLALFASAVASVSRAGDEPKKPEVPQFFASRSGAKRELALREGGGTMKSEAAVARGLRWLALQQQADGSWKLEGTADANSTAATGFGLLPLLAAGKTHEPDAKNPFDKNVDKGLKFLMKSQDAKTGFFGGTMYSHGLATIALCEVYGMTQDPALRKSAQLGIDLIVNTQHPDNGGWSYAPNKNDAHRDLSISGWQMMALKTGQGAGLQVPQETIQRCKKFLAQMHNPDSGYGYTPGSASTSRMTAVGLLNRQYMENWGPANPNMIKAFMKFIRTNPPDRQDVYYYYYATQVIHHHGGEAWRDWNEKMREYLVNKQDTGKGANDGSWSPDGDPWSKPGGA
jgi:hypothetical protein